MIKALDRYDPESSLRFAHYAEWWIRHALSRTLIRRTRLARATDNISTLLQINRVRRVSSEPVAHAS